MLAVAQVTVIAAQVSMYRPCTDVYVSCDPSEWLDCKPAGFCTVVKAALDMDVVVSVSMIETTESRGGDFVGNGQPSLGNGFNWGWGGMRLRSHTLT